MPLPDSHGSSTGLREPLLADYLNHRRKAASDPGIFIEDLGKDDFLADNRTQQAVVMSLIIIGKAAIKILDRFATFVELHRDVP